MLLFVLIAVFMIFLARKVFPDLVRFEPKAFGSFLVTMALITVLRVFHVTITGLRPMNLDLFNLPSLFLVFWEDMLFVFPSLLLYHLTKNKYLVAPVAVVSSLLFSIGHIYQSVEWALILLAYVPAMLYFAKKHGLGTVMVCHVTYDVLTYLTFYVISLSISLGIL